MQRPAEIRKGSRRRRSLMKFIANNLSGHARREAIFVHIPFYHNIDSQ